MRTGGKVRSSLELLEVRTGGKVRIGLEGKKDKEWMLNIC